MKIRSPEQIEKRRTAIGSATIVLVVGLASAIVTALGLAQMA